jgi:hypothetical protein
MNIWKGLSTCQVFVATVIVGLLNHSSLAMWCIFRIVEKFHLLVVELSARLLPRTSSKLGDSPII